MRKAHLYIDGHIKGTGYDKFIKQKADELNIKGHIRITEGNAEVVIEGPNEAIEALITHCKQGITTTTIDNVMIEEQEPGYIFKDFHIRA